MTVHFVGDIGEEDDDDKRWDHHHAYNYKRYWII